MHRIVSLQDIHLKQAYDYAWQEIIGGAITINHGKKNVEIRYNTFKEMVETKFENSKSDNNLPEIPSDEE